MAPNGRRNSPVKIYATLTWMMMMANEPKPAKKKFSEPGHRQNAQGDHEGSAHSPDEFDALNPQKQGLGEGRKIRRPKETTDDR